jgi:hypothetical protein
MVLVEHAPLWEMLRALDELGNLEFPADYHHRRARKRFDELVRLLDDRFGMAAVVDREIQDASLHGRIDIPARATSSGRPLVVSVSNFGDLAVTCVDNPGVWTEAQTRDLLHPSDGTRISAALVELGYVEIPEEPLWQPYDGWAPVATWWGRYFDYV